MKSTPQTLAALSLAAAACLAAPTLAQAAALTFNSASPGSIVVGACDFEGGFTLNGSSLGFCGVGAGGGTTVSSSSLAFSGTWYTPGSHAPTGLVSVYFVGPGDAGQISDILTYEITNSGSNSNITGTFTSGFGSSLGSLPVGATSVLAGGSFSFDYAFFGGVVTTGGLTAPVAAPASLALAGLGLVLLGGLRRRA